MTQENDQWAKLIGEALDGAMYELRKSGLKLEMCCSRHILLIDPADDEIVWETDV